MTDIVKVTDLGFSYPNSSQKAINKLSFTVAAGSSLGIIGPNGAGKSTLFNLLCGLLVPNAGQITIAGLDAHANSFKLIRQKVGLAFANPDDQLFCLSVAEDIAFGPQNMGLTEAQIAARCQKVLADLNIEHLAALPPYRLSDGEKKKAALAAVLAMEPEILLLDEPTITLDPRSRRQLINTINNLPQTKIVASHDLDMIWDTCTEVLILNQGQTAAFGPTALLLKDQNLLAANELELPLSLMPR